MTGRLDRGDEGPDIRGDVGRGMNGEEQPVNPEPYLEGAAYPVRKGELLDRARQQGAPEGVRRLLEGLPDRQYDGIADVSRAIGSLGR
jgi:hypothetical protein